MSETIASDENNFRFVLAVETPSATSSDEEKRLYDLQMAMLDTRSFWPPEDWTALMEKLQRYTAAIRAEESRKGYAGGWRDALEAAGQHLEELAQR